ncbi:MAG: MBL fold metallo-hydrolase [Synergistales bacterium]|nr:MBL fold metallo-hydrolase [Synergistales bacterium]MDY6400999.1 MBL fold metallo-hydrolase [Synergistales bacterium]MDY6405135.1 MBL fold metallo-hydrolase [Synergistales bacterium]MDY6411072.1 MBL fold metallo-hydrolase [Synergistales bacterium]MDY6414900.1 MBL fold metallo-hydrolase [Synergistales bacterium]
MHITMLGTGNALVTECYNTCFVISDENEKNNFLVDGGGGNGVLHQLKHAGFELQDIQNIFVTHQHIDHLLGIIWIIIISAQLMNKNKFCGSLNIYSHDEVINLLYDITKKLLLPYQFDFIGRQIFLKTANDKEELKIMDHDVKFFDIHSDRTKQYGFLMELDGGKKLTCCGDEPCSLECESYVRKSDWLLHEAFCLHSQAEFFSPYEKHHSTVKDTCELAERLEVKNLLLYHTEDHNLKNRKELYEDEGRKYFSGNIFIPNDLEKIEL